MYASKVWILVNVASFIFIIGVLRPNYAYDHVLFKTRWNVL